MRLRIDNGRWVDPEGDPVVLRGINVSGAQAKANLVEREDLEAIASWGMKCIRYVLFWADLEPEPGAYNEDKLHEIQQTLDWAHDLGIYVLLDMHQDLYAVRPGGGMPMWSVLHTELPHISTGDVWSMAYFESPWVMGAFDAFFTNEIGPGGVGLQDRFAQCWQMLAQRFGTHPALLGYDLLNEPAAGSPVSEAIGMAAEAIITAAGATPPEDASPFETGLFAFSLAENDPALFAVLIETVGPTLVAIAETRLKPMYRRVTEAIREVDTSTPIFIEPFITANLGLLPQSLRWDGPTGNDPNLVWAPHIYEADPDRAAAITKGLLELGAREHMPVVIGEWGNLDNSDGIFDRDPLDGTRIALEILEAAGAGTMYWAYSRDLHREPFFEEFVRRE